LIPPSELETNPALWLLAVSQYKVRDTFCSYSVMELCTKGLGSQTESLKVSNSVVRHNLPSARWCLGAFPATNGCAKCLQRGENHQKARAASTETMLFLAKGYIWISVILLQITRLLNIKERLLFAFWSVLQPVLIGKCWKTEV